MELPKRSDENVCATAGFDRDVSFWVFQSHVGGIVRGRDANLVPGGCNDDKGFFLRDRGGG